MANVGDFWKKPGNFITEDAERQGRWNILPTDFKALVIKPDTSLWLVITHEVDEKCLPYHGAYLLDAPTRHEALMEFSKHKDPGAYHNVTCIPFWGDILNARK